MRIAVIEIMPMGHYTLVDSIARIYDSNPNCEINIFTTEKGKEVLLPLIGTSRNLKIDSLKSEDSNEVKKFLNQINSTKFDRIYVVTLEKYFKEFSKINFQSPVHLFVHNIYQWFKLDVFNCITRFISDYKRNENIVYSFKSNFSTIKFKKKIKDLVYKTGGRIVVLNNNLKKELLKFEVEKNIEIVPFSLIDERLINKNIGNNKIRLCIPGMVSQLRRDYMTFLKVLSKTGALKKIVTIDLLGGIGISEMEGGKQVVDEAEKLKNEGWDIIIYNKPLVPLFEFDEQLAKADMIIGNLHVTIDKNNIYGKSKDSGIIYTMIKAAKPGFLPSDYNNLSELESSTIIFDNYDDLFSKLTNIIEHKSELDDLKNNALINSNKFLPKVIYEQLNNLK